MSGRSPFSPDRGHFHHLLMDRGMAPQQALLLIISAALGLAVLGWLLQLFAPQLSAVVFVAITLTYMHWVRRSGWDHGKVKAKA